MSADPAPLIVTALLGADDLAWLDRLRRAHFPPERNLLAAHLTLFHHLPPNSLPELKRRLRTLAKAGRPHASTAGLINLGRGVAIRIASPGLEDMRADLAHAFSTLLTPQDRAGWRPHVTIQNKVEPAVARTLLQMLERTFQPQPIRLDGFGVFYYRGGPWEPAAVVKFDS